MEPGTTGQRLIPVRVAGGLSFAAVTAGRHTCGVTIAGAAYCWGDNTQGELGDGTTTDRSSPVLVAGGLSFNTVTDYGGHTCGITLRAPPIAGGLTADGELGDGTTIDRLTPVPVTGGMRFAAITVGWNHTCGITVASVAYCWGGNSAGQLGNGTATWTTATVTPAAVAGGSPSRRCLPEPTVHLWGHFHRSRLLLGRKRRRPARRRDHDLPIEPGARVRRRELHRADQRRNPHLCGSRQSAPPIAGAGIANGQLGDGDGTWSGRLSPVLVAGGLSFAAVTAGYSHTCGITFAGAAYCWGGNANGNLGDGTTTDRPVPVKVVGQP